MERSPRVRYGHTGQAMILLCLLSLTLVAPASMGLPLAGPVVITPNQDPLTPGILLNLTTLVTVAPSGGGAFPSGHTITLETGLETAVWHVVILTNGRPAAQIPSGGPRVFINGYLLSYSSTEDVAIDVNLSGRVPRELGSGGASLLLFRCAELDNQGLVVPGSEIIVTRSVASAAPPAEGTSPAPSSPAPVPPSATPPQALGTPAWLPVCTIAGLGSAALARRRMP